MAQRLSRSSPYVRLTFDASPLHPSSRCTPHRAFSISAHRSAKARTNFKQGDQGHRPSTATMQSEQMMNLKPSDLPDDIGMMRATYFFPSQPSLFKDYKLRLSQYYEFLKQYLWADPVPNVSAKFRFWLSLPARDIPPNLPKSRVPFSKRPRLDLETFTHGRVAKDLHRRSYLAIQHAVENNSMKEIKETCHTGLTQTYTRLVQNHTSKREVVKWEVKYKPFGCWVMSRKFAISPILVDGLPVCQQQVVARIKSAQTMTAGKVVGFKADGSPDIAWGSPKRKTMTENIIISRKLIGGVFDQWKVYGFRNSKGTREELEAWREVQNTIPGEEGKAKPTAQARGSKGRSRVVHV